MRDRDLGIADVPGDLGQAGFMGRIAIGMHQYDGHRPQAPIEGRLQRKARTRLIERAHQTAIGRHPLVDFDDFPMQELGQHNMSVEETRSSLIADAWRIGEATSDHQQKRLTLALEQCVGCDRGAHLDRFDLVGGHWIARRHAEQPTDAGNRGIGILFGILGQQFGADERPIRTPANHIGEGAPTIDPELPAARRRRVESVCVMSAPLRGRRGLLVGHGKGSRNRIAHCVNRIIDHKPSTGLISLALRNRVQADSAPGLHATLPPLTPGLQTA